MSSPSKSLESAWAKGGPSWLDVSVEYGEGQLASIEGYENAARVQLAPKPKRLAHSLSVGLTAERLAAIYGVEPYLARVAGILHDWEKVLPARESIARASGLGIELGVELALVEPLLHGMIAARELPERFPELPDDVWQAIDRHTLGNAHMSPLDMVVFVADGIEPLRKPADAIKRQRKLVGKASLSDLYWECFSDGVSYVIETRRYLYPGTLSIYNDIVLERAQERDDK
ncbi:bis(5'-nucleosyl)-tetraphosphatase (symmetrical) YqeK [Parolsenella catena]|uniref:bis(5'-nucleosyl)-tetraphosphatase (symmetrical) YqeK n=1 Tax=Parolsenella catena TaxID=2003188 RepID=UPI00319EB7DA